MHTNQAFLHIQTKTGRRITKQLGNSLNKQFEVNEVIFSFFFSCLMSTAGIYEDSPF